MKNILGLLLPLSNRLHSQAPLCRIPGLYSIDTVRRRQTLKNESAHREHAEPAKERGPPVACAAGTAG